MSVIISDLSFYGSANMAETDGITQGGAVAFNKRVVFNDINPAGLLNYVSSGADTTQTITVTGRDATGAIQTETKTFNGTTPVAGAQTFERLLKGVISAATAVGDLAAISNTAIVTGTAVSVAAATSSAPAQITLAAGQGASVSPGQIVRITGGTTGINQLRMIVSVSGDVCNLNRDWDALPTGTITYGVYEGMLFDKLPNQVTEVRRPFYNVSADVAGGANRTYYEKIFAVNNNTATALTAASIIKQVDPVGATSLQFALASALNDTGTVANRQTAPAAGITAFSTGAAPQTIAVPTPQNLPSGAAPNAAGAQGVWLALTLNAGLAAGKTSLVIRTTGSTT